MRYPLIPYPVGPFDSNFLHFFWKFPFGVAGFISLVVGLSLAALCLYAAWQKESEERGLYLGGMLAFIGYGFLGLTLALRATVADRSLSIDLNTWLYPFVSLLTPGTGYMIYVWTRSRLVYWALWPSTIVAVLVILAPFFPSVFGPLFLDEWQEYEFGMYPKAAPLLSAWAGTSLIGSYVCIIVLWRYSRRLKKPGMRTVLYGLIGVALLTGSNAPSLVGIPLLPLGIFIFLPLLVVAYGMFRSDFLDMNDLLFRKHGLFFIVFLVLSGCLLALSFFANAAFSSTLQEPIGLASFIPLLSAVLVFLLGVAVAGSSPGSRLNQISALYMFSFGAYLIIMVVGSLDVHPIFFKRMDQIGFTIFALAPMMGLRAVYAVIERKTDRVTRAVDLVSVLTACLTFSPYLSVGYYKYDFGLIAATGPVRILFVLNSIVVILIALTKLILAQKRDLRILFTSFFFFTSGTLTFANVPATMGYPIYPYGNFQFLPFILFTVGLVRFGGFDVQGNAVRISRRISLLSFTLVSIFGVLYFQHLEGDLLTRLFCSLIVVGPLMVSGYMLLFVLTRPVTQRMDESIATIERERKNVEAANREIEHLNAFARRIHATKDLDSLMRGIIHELSARFGVSRLWLFLVDNDKQEFYTRRMVTNQTATETEVQEAMAFRTPISPESGLLFRVYSRQKPVYVPVLEPPFPTKVDEKIVKMSSLKSVLLVPLIVHGETIGLMNFDAYDRQLDLKHSDLEALERYGEQFSGAVRNSLLLREVQDQREVLDDLLLNILPEPVAVELKDTGGVEPHLFDSATILIADFRGFSGIAVRIPPAKLIRELDRIFEHFDNIGDEYNLESLKTLGDSYICAGGLPVKNNTHAVDACLAGLEMQAMVKRLADLKQAKLEQQDEEESDDLEHMGWDLRVGIHTGPAIAGVIGKKKFTYDIWGDSVNIAQRMEKTGETGRVNISEDTYEQVKFFFECTPHGSTEINQPGGIEMYYVNRLRPELCDDQAGIIPNSRFDILYERLKLGERLEQADESP